MRGELSGVGTGGIKMLFRGTTSREKGEGRLSLHALRLHELRLKVGESGVGLEGVKGDKGIYLVSTVLTGT